MEPCGPGGEDVRQRGGRGGGDPPTIRRTGTGTPWRAQGTHRYQGGQTDGGREEEGGGSQLGGQDQGPLGDPKGPGQKGKQGRSWPHWRRRRRLAVRHQTPCSSMIAPPPPLRGGWDLVRYCRAAARLSTGLRRCRGRQEQKGWVFTTHMS